MKGKRAAFILAAALTIIISIVTIVNPYISSLIVDQVITDKQTQKLIPLLLFMGAAQLFRITLRFSSIVLYEKCSQLSIVNIKNHLYHVLQSQDMHFYDRNHTGELMNRLTGDINMVRHTVAYVFYNIVEAVVIFLSTCIYFFSVNVLLTISLLSLAPVIVAVSSRFFKNVRPLYQQLREKMTLLNNCAKESIAGNRVIKAFSREQYQEAVFDEKNIEYREASLTASYTWLKYYPYIETLTQILTILTVLLGGIFIINGSLTPGELLAFTSLTWAIAYPMRNLGPLLSDIQRFSVAASRVIEIYYSKPSITDKKRAKSSKGRLKGKITFENVTFKFNNDVIFDNLSFEVQPGQTLAIMGPTGSGKTTLFNLIARFYDVTSGRILIDDVDVRDWKLSTLRSSIGMAIQEVFLFSDTIDSNIAYGDIDLPEKDVELFAHISDSAEFIEHLPEKYETIIGERGVGLSGGQRQRLALARALAIRPTILMLDDTTSALDSETEQYIREQLDSLDFTCTKLIVAQRIASVKNADNIIVLGKGKILESGTHEELLEKRGYYYEIFCLQTGSTDIKAGVNNGSQQI